MGLKQKRKRCHLQQVVLLLSASRNTNSLFSAFSYPKGIRTESKGKSKRGCGQSRTDRKQTHGRTHGESHEDALVQYQNIMIEANERARGDAEDECDFEQEGGRC